MSQRRRRRPNPAFPGAEQFPIPEQPEKNEEENAPVSNPEQALSQSAPQHNISEAEIDDVNSLPVSRDNYKKIVDFNNLNDEISPVQQSPQQPQPQQAQPQQPQPVIPEIKINQTPEDTSHHNISPQSDESFSEFNQDDDFLNEIISEDEIEIESLDLSDDLPGDDSMNNIDVASSENESKLPDAPIDEMENILNQIVDQPTETESSENILNDSVPAQSPNSQPLNDQSDINQQLPPESASPSSGPGPGPAPQPQEIIPDDFENQIDQIRNAFDQDAESIPLPEDQKKYSPISEDQEQAVSIEEQLAAKGIDKDMLEDMMDGNADEKVELPQLHMASRRANLAASNNLPIASAEVKSNDEIGHLLAAFSNLEYGQMGIVRLCCRSVPQFRPEAKEWLRAIKAGEDIEAPAKSIPQKLLAGLRYIGAFSRYHIYNSYKPGLAGEAPRMPWSRGKDLAPLPSSQVDEEDKQAWKSAAEKARDTAHYEVVMRVGAIGQPDDKENLEMIVEEAAAGLDVFTTPHQEIVWEQGNPRDTALGMMGARAPDKPSMVLSAAELASIAHLPDDSTQPHGINVKRSYFKQLPIANPLRIDDPYNPNPGDIPMGLMNPRSEDEVVIGMRNSEFDKHMITVGKTGSGKSEWMKWVIFGIAKSGYPLALVDPHGAAAEDVLNALIINCPERVKDIVFCDISDSQYPVALNPLDVSSREMVEPSVKSIQEMLSNPKVGFDKASAPRAMVYAIDALTALCHANLVLEDPQNKCTLLDVLTFFNDSEFRHLVIEFCQNESIRQKYDLDNGNFEMMSEKTQLEHTQTLTRVFSSLSQTESFSAVFYSPENKLDFGKLIAEKKIILIRLSRFSHQAELGEFIGSLILPWMLSSMDDWGRKKDEITGELSGSGCRIIVDEAPTMMGPNSSVPTLLAEARKWDLGLIMLAQFLDQFDAQIIDSALANTASKVAMVQDPNKAGPIAKAIAASSSRVTPADIAQLPPFHFYGNVLLPTAGAGLSNSGPFSAACMPMIKSKMDQQHIALRQEIKDRSRRMISNDIEDIRARSRHRIDNLKEALQTKLRDQMHGDFTPAPMFTDEEAGETFGWKG
jgi:hypothetical protein